MSVTIQNKTKRQQVFNLPHGIVCEDTDGGCLCGRQRVGIQHHDSATGEKSVRALNRRLAGSITLNAFGTPGDKLAGLPQGVAHVPEVADAKRRGEIIVTVDAAPEAKTSAPSKPSKPAASAATVKE